MVAEKNATSVASSNRKIILKIRTQSGLLKTYFEFFARLPTPWNENIHNFVIIIQERWMLLDDFLHYFCEVYE